MTTPDEGRVVDRSAAGGGAVNRSVAGPILPDSTTDDTNAGWGEREYADDERFLRERPPHWD